MTRSYRTLYILLISAGIFAVLCFVILRPAITDSKAHIFMLDIGQGDSFLIEAANGKTLLIDGGRDTTVLSELSKVLPVGHNTIDVMIATHPDADHIGGLQYVLDRYHVGLFLTSQVTADTKTFTALYKELQKEHITSYYVRRGMVITLDAADKTTFTVLFPDRDTTNWITNPASVVGRLQVGVRSALFTGDSTSSVEHFLVQTDPQDLHSDILKLGHHGSKFSSSTEYLQAVSPVLGLISAGINNKYGHPNVQTVGRLQTLDIPWISTQQKGTVELTTDGTVQWTWHSVQ
jgi:competence protein ComEC